MSVTPDIATTAPVVPLQRAAGLTEHAAAVSERPLVVDLGTDWHVTTDLGLGGASAVAMVDAAQAAGLAAVGICDTVTAETGWLPEYVEMARVFARPGLTVRCGVETAVLDTAGRLDLPADVPALDYVLLTADALPGANGPVGVAEVRAALETGVLTPADVVGQLVSAMAAAAAAAPAQAVLGRPFGLVAQLGLDDDVVTAEHLTVLAAACAATGARVEVDETWRAPSARVAAALADAGVTLVAGSGATGPRAVGTWRYLAALTGTAPVEATDTAETPLPFVASGNAAAFDVDDEVAAG